MAHQESIDSPSVQEMQRRVVRVLAAAQILGGIGVAAGAAVGALLAADLSMESLSGLSSASSTIGAAVIALPVARVMTVSGRRPGLLLAYAIGIVGAIVVFLAVMTEIWAMPPYWVHAVLWPPLILGLSLGLLRPMKALMIALQFRNQAGEGKGAGFE